MNWAMAESEAFRRCGMCDDDDAEEAEYQRYLALQREAQETKPATSSQAAARTSVSAVMEAPTRSGEDANRPASVRQVLEREHESRQSALESRAQASRRRETSLTAGPPLSSKPPSDRNLSNEQAWAEIQGNSKQHAKDSLDFLSQWGGVLR